MTEAVSQTSLRSRYTSLATDRQPFLNRAYQCSRLTIPTLIPRETERTDKNTIIDTPQPWQSIGAMGVNTLSAKLSMTLLPAQTPFYQLVMGAKEREELLGLEGDERAAMAAGIEAKLQRLEQDILEDLELSPLRPIVFNMFKHLLAAGNYALYADDEAKGFPMDRFVVVRDGSGNVLEGIVRETVSPMALPEEWLKKVSEGNQQAQDDIAKGKDLDIYTCVKRVGKNAWVTWQEVLDEEVPKTRGRYTNENNPWIFLRMIVVDGEDYGRSYVEELYGDLQSAEDLSKSIVQGGMIAAQCRWLVKPSGMTDIDDLEESNNGDFVPGQADDVQALRAEKLADFQHAANVLQTVTSRLERAFLMTASIQRQAERVTAHEISLMSQELEDTLGGYYTLLAREFQLPLIQRWVSKMQKEGRLPKFPKNSIRPKIVTGIDALGRGHNLQRLRGFFQDVLAYAQVKQGMGNKFSDDEVIQRLANGHGLDATGMVIPDEVIQQQQAEQQALMAQQAIAEKAAGPAAGALAQAATQPQQAA